MLLGVIAVAGLRVLVTFGLVAAIMTLTIVGISVYSFAIFLVSTPVVWLAGWGIISGAYKSLRNRAINMDVLVLSRSGSGLDLWCTQRLLPSTRSGRGRLLGSISGNTRIRLVRKVY